MRFIWPLLALFLLVSCATNKKAAIQLSEQGLHEAALEKWLAAYKDDAGDIEVQVGLRICQEKVVNDRLVHIRDLRLSQNHEEAILNLKKLIDSQASWQLKLDFNTSTFQGKEVEALWNPERSKLIKLANQEKPLAAEMRNRRISHIFKAMPDYASVKNGISESGRKLCGKMKQPSPQAPFYASYVSQYCLFFNPNEKKKVAKTSQQLFAGLDAKLSIFGVSSELTSVMGDSFSKSFTGTPWFHVDAKKTIKLQLTGHYETIPSSVRIPQVHNYTVQVPYTDYETVNKKRQVPYESSVQSCKFDQIASREICTMKSETKYHTEHYTVSEPVTRYRDDPRIFNYVATKKTQDIVLQLSGKASLDDKVLPFAFTKDIREEKILHDMNMPEIGLRPATSDISSPAEHFAELSKVTASDFARDLNQHWISKFCSMPGSRDRVAIGEHVLRCRKAKDFPIAFVDGWFENTENLKGHEVEELLGQF